MGEKSQKTSPNGHNIIIYKYSYIFKETCPDPNNMMFQIKRLPGTQHNENNLT